MTLPYPDSVNSVVLMDELGFTHVTGPFEFLHEAGNWEATIDLDETDRPGALTPTRAATLAENHQDATALALADCEPVAYGDVIVVDCLEEEGFLVIAVDDPTHVNPSDVDVDLDQYR